MLAHRKKVPTGSRSRVDKTLKMLHDSFRKIRSDLFDKGINYIVENLLFAAFMTFYKDDAK